MLRVGIALWLITPVAAALGACYCTEANVRVNLLFEREAGDAFFTSTRAVFDPMTGSGPVELTVIAEDNEYRAEGSASIVVL